MRGTSPGVGLGLSGTSCPSECGGRPLALSSFSARSLHVFLNLRRDKDKPHRCLAPAAMRPVRKSSSRLRTGTPLIPSQRHATLRSRDSQQHSGGQQASLVPLTNGETAADVTTGVPYSTRDCGPVPEPGTHRWSHMHLLTEAERTLPMWRSAGPSALGQAKAGGGRERAAGKGRPLPQQPCPSGGSSRALPWAPRRHQ